MENRFTKVYVIGSGELPLSCAHIAAKYTSSIEILEVKLTDGSFLEKKCSSENISYRALSKKEITDILSAEEGNCLVVSASSTYLIPLGIISKSNLFIINWHNALLPSHKGRNAECWAIYSGDDATGITWHMLTGDVDGGDIILQQEIPIDETETSLSLFKKQIEAGGSSFEEIAPMLFIGNVETAPQRKDPLSVMHYSRDIPNDGFLDMNWDYKKTSCFLRAMDYGAFSLLGSCKVIINDETYIFRKYDLNGDSSLPAGFDGTNLVLKKDEKTIILKKLKKTDGC